jgi:hypothetical protein
MMTISSFQRKYNSQKTSQKSLRLFKKTFPAKKNSATVSPLEAQYIPKMFS